VIEAVQAMNHVTQEAAEVPPRNDDLNVPAAYDSIDDDVKEHTEAARELATPSPDEEDAIDHTQAAEKRINTNAQWGQLMRKPKIPLCEDHEEPCKEFQTKKKGVNCGRIFYICARPLGPSGEKERNTQWRCRTFIWASDWQGGAGG
jgi:AP endonuclease-2